MSTTLLNSYPQNYATNPISYVNGTYLSGQNQTAVGGQQAWLQNLLQGVVSQLQQNGFGGQSSLAMNPAMGYAQPMTAQNASATLASYMTQNGISAENPNSLYQLATNGLTPQPVREAAQFMLANPQIYEQIETHDVLGQDGISGTSNFHWAAMGGLGPVGNIPGGLGGGAVALGLGSNFPGAGQVIPPTGGLGGYPTMGGTSGLPVNGGLGGYPTTGGMNGLPTTGGLGGFPTMGGYPTTGGMSGMGGIGLGGPVAIPAATGDLVADGKPLQLGAEGQALAMYSQQDQPGFQAFENALASGNPSDATRALAKSVSSGKISQAMGAALGGMLQQTANAHGGGRVSGSARDQLSDTLGGDNVLAHGKSIGRLAFEHVTGVDTTNFMGINTL
ncbi:hypothetical protein G3O00_38210 [Burkholderia sp. Ac-20384]|uniref:hypothetical protein n=1 Tax=Burkholderia sp. Ac-20384 TaxID=2703902 RepID=UPI00197CF759|nr:hypothetical protein [Burkholderia sp. Ac-20384]MBN3829396.1 hypothetical protein [Burkholderia sp. Ac-20384]